MSASPFANVDRGLCRTTSTPLALTLALALALTPTPAVTLPPSSPPAVLYEHLRTRPQYRRLSFGLYTLIVPVHRILRQPQIGIDVVVERKKRCLSFI